MRKSSFLLKRAIPLLMVFFLGTGCERFIQEKVSEYLKEFEEALSQKNEMLADNPVQLSVSIAQPNYQQEEVDYYSQEVSIDYQVMGLEAKSEVKVNGIVMNQKPLLLSDEGLYYVLIKGTDKVGRTSYWGKRIFIDKTAPVIKFVNTMDAILLANINSFIDSVPDNAISDEGSGINLSSKKAWWKEGVAPSQRGRFIRCYTVEDNVGNRSAVFEHSVRVTEIMRGDKEVVLLKGFEFDGVVAPSDTAINSLSSNFDFSQEGYMCYRGNSSDNAFILNQNFTNESFDYVELSVSWRSSSYHANIYIINESLGSNVGVNFLKLNRNPNCFFMNSSWSSQGGINLAFNTTGSPNVIGILETERGGLIYFNGNETPISFSRGGKYLYNDGVGLIRFGFNNDTKIASVTVKVDYIRFYKVVTE